MKILMLGWEYPPHISGGLGTACEGLTRALASEGVAIDFVVPRLFGREDAEHMHLLGTLGPDGRPVVAPRAAPSRSDRPPVPLAEPHEAPRRTLPPHLIRIAAELAGEAVATALSEMERLGPDDPEGTVRRVAIPALLAPYFTPESYAEVLEALEGEAAARGLPPEAVAASFELPSTGQPRVPREAHAAPGPGHYGDDLFAEVARYAHRAVQLVPEGPYDLIHAHDWMTFPAGIELKKRLGVPLVLHVHSLERDRSGLGGNPGIIAIERAGFEAADRIVAVSYFTRDQIHRVHGVPLERISVVHNGVYTEATVERYRQERQTSGPVVLFLGRVTFQKGPEYFVQAARRVLDEIPDATFVMAGSGDMLPRMIDLVRELRIEEAFRFPGFVRGPDVERMYSIADIYVMPSVSEPFGITALEAVSYDRPVIVSRQSGVSEVLRHALKVDFWDVERLANQIVALLRYPELRDSIVEMAREEVRRIHWKAAAQKLLPVYEAFRPRAA